MGEKEGLKAAEDQRGCARCLKPIEVDFGKRDKIFVGKRIGGVLKEKFTQWNGLLEAVMVCACCAKKIEG